MTAKYINHTRNGLKRNHKYEVYFDKPKDFYVYDAYIVYDLTEDHSVDIILNYASQISIKQNFEFEGDLQIEGKP